MALEVRSWGARWKAACPGKTGLQEWICRAIELSVAILGLGILFLLLPFLALAIQLDSPGPVFYGQIRVGYQGRPFKLWKLRTMRVDAEADGQPRWAAPDDPRVTRVGRWLRRSRLDELPQFWNVLRGEMSLVGPRPERPEIEEELRKHIPGHEKRYQVKPGIISLSMFHTGYVDSLEKARKRLNDDLLYISHQSLSLNLKLMARGFLYSVQLRSR